MKKKKVDKKDDKYSKLCGKCSSIYPPTRVIIQNEIFWLHDNINQCKAAKLREEDFLKSRGE